MTNKSTKFVAKKNKYQPRNTPQPLIYVHFPFCATRCIYCDFYSTTLRNRGEEYVHALEQEMEERRGFIEGSIHTIYLGGGTPSQLGPAVITQVLEALGRHFDLCRCEEITMEANPEDIADASLWPFSSPLAPINRISMGVQSMVDSELVVLHRRHDAQRVRDAVARLRKAGIENISLDLMYGLPNQTLESWAYSIDELLKLKPEHISAYCLSIEEGTRLNLMVERGELTPCDDELCLEMAQLLREKLRAAGYEQYEISNYALPGYHSRHNSAYWDQTPYLGLGPGAHSYDGKNLRCWNEPQLLNYLKGIRKKGQEQLSELDLYNERVMLGFRTKKGVSLSTFNPYHAQVGNIIQSLLDRRLVHIHQKDYLALTEEGLALGDEVIRELMIL